MYTTITMQRKKLSPLGNKVKRFSVIKNGFIGN